MNVALIEDEVPALEHLERLLLRCRPDTRVVARLRTVRQTRAWLASPGVEYDLVVADIQLGDGTSLDALGEADVAVPVIFTTAHDQYWSQAFDRNGVGYLLKPVRQEALAAALQRLERLERHFVGSLRAMVQGLQSAPSRLVGRRGRDWVGVSVVDVRWIRVRRGMITAHTAAGTEILLEESLQHLQTVLEPANFFRANRWYLVSLTAVTRVRAAGRGRLALVLDPPSEDVVEVPQQHAAAFKAWFGVP